MKEITHRQMRNESGDVLRRVADGETIVITNRGRPAAVIGPPANDVIAELAARGELRPAVTSPHTLRTIRRRTATRSTRELLDDVRGDR